MPGDIILKMENITKRFPGVLANDHINFDLKEKEVHALVGENGAGKSTLMKILYGLYHPDEGTIYIKIDGELKPVKFKNPQDAIRHGIGMVHQHFMLVYGLTTIENIILGYEPSSVIDFDTARKNIEKIMTESGLHVPLDVDVEVLSVGQQQRVEILKVLYRNAKILILDEPTAVLTPQETEELFTIINRLKEQGHSIIFISHKLHEVMEIADRISVMRKGRLVHTMPKSEATKEKIAELMVGHPVLLDVPRPDVTPGDVILEVKDLTVESDTKGVMAVNNVSFHIKAGEIYGIAGVEGNGQAELIEAIYGLRHPKKGQVIIKGEDITGKPTHIIRKKGVSHIPGDRHKFGVFLPFTLADNSILGHHREEKFARYGIFRRFSNISKWAMEIIKKFDVRTPSEKVPMSALSGGNQQKFVVGREISFDHDLMIAAHPTRGVDIGAMEFIYRQLFEEKKQNKAILLVSADLDELLLLSDRIGVMFKGKIIKELDNTNRQVTPKEVGYYMLGGDLESHNGGDTVGGEQIA